jgi:thiamine-phosphate pyrophosphorylase
MKIMLVLDHGTFGDRCLDIAQKCAPYADIVWFRIKDKDIVRREAEKLRRALPDSFLSLSLDADTAYELGYQAVQLGADSDISGIREKYPELKIGYSAHGTEEIISKDADYYTLSPVFHTVKDYEVKPLGALDVSHMGKDIYALGGIGTDNIGEIKNKGYAGVAGISFYENLKELNSMIHY